MLNCKPGDLALVTRSYAQNEGKIVRCLYFVGQLPSVVRLPSGRLLTVRHTPLDIWRIDTPLNVRGRLTDGSRLFIPNEWYFCSDARLRPLRGHLSLEDELDTIFIAQGVSL